MAKPANCLALRVASTCPEDKDMAVGALVATQPSVVLEQVSMCQLFTLQQLFSNSSSLVFLIDLSEWKQSAMVFPAPASFLGAQDACSSQRLC